jgi:uncharacterized protein YggE
MLKNYLLSFVSLALFACSRQPIVVQAHPLAAAATPASNTENRISVQGHARENVRPNRLDLRVSLVNTGERPAEIIRKLGEQRKSLREAVLQKAVEGTMVTFTALSLAPHFEGQGRERVRKGFAARTVLTISMQDFDKVGEYMQIAADHGARDLRTRFHNTALVARKEVLRAKAIEAGRRKAEQMTKLVGARLGKVLSVQESYAGADGWQSHSLANVELGSASSALELYGEALNLDIRVTILYELDS